jgi:Spy/CpxP family protein refolding chaperone
MRTHIASIVMAAAVLTAASLLAPFARAATDPLMPSGPNGQPFDPNPAAPGSPTNQFMRYGVDSDGNSIPLKTLRITNNTAQTVYPIMRDPNSNTLKNNKEVGLYDPYDPANMEYRGTSATRTRRMENTTSA